MSVGGLFWFTDLSVCDPYRLLPLITSVSMYYQLKLGTEGANLDQMGPLAKKVMMMMPVPLFLITMNFPAVSTITYYLVDKVNRVSSLSISVKIQNCQKMPSVGATGLKCQNKIFSFKRYVLRPTECLN